MQLKEDIKGAMLIFAMASFFAIGSAWVQLWDCTWRIAVAPIRAEAYRATIPQSACLSRSWWWWRESGCRLA
jgi:hypothetical protein